MTFTDGEMLPNEVKKKLTSLAKEMVELANCLPSTFGQLKNMQRLDVAQISFLSIFEITVSLVSVLLVSNPIHYIYLYRSMCILWGVRASLSPHQTTIWAAKGTSPA